MLTLDVLESLRFTDKPRVHDLFVGIAAFDYAWPANPTEVILDHPERIPTKGPVILALNHTDRFGSIPLQAVLIRKYKRYTTAWVKGKYYANPLMRWFWVTVNMLPVPSKGYVIESDLRGQLPEEVVSKLYRFIKTQLDQEMPPDDGLLLERAQAAGYRKEVQQLLEHPRSILGLSYRPGDMSYIATLRELFGKMMERFVELNLQAADLGLMTLIFPEGTRQKKLGRGHTGLAQMALRTKATIVPIGCNGTDRIYPGDSPLSKGGVVEYRIGEPLTPDGDLAPFQIDEPYRPFTQETQASYGEHFNKVTELMMSRLAGLLDDEYLP